MADITVTIPVDEALFTVAALERHAAAAYASVTKLIEQGATDGDFLLDVAMTTALKCEAANRRLTAALYPWDAMRREDVADEISLGLS